MEGGNNFEQAVALIASANKVVQDPNSVGSALRTISLRLRGTSVEVLEEIGEETDGVVESTSKLQEKLKALTGVDIVDMNGAYKDTYTILKEIGSVWKDLDPMDQAAALELMAGKNRANTLAAILNNMKDLEGAYNDALKAEGSALKENQAYLDSIQGRIDIFNNSVQTMWMNFIDSDAVKFIVDLGTVLIQTIEKMGLLNVALVALIATLSRKQLAEGFKSIFEPGTKNIQGLISNIGSLITSTNKLTRTTLEDTLALKLNSKEKAKQIIVDAGLTNVVGLLTEEQRKATAATLTQAFADKTLTTSQYLAAMSTMGLNTAMQALWEVIKANPVMWISALVMAAATAFDHFHTTAAEAMEKTKEAFEEMRSVVESTKSTIQSLESELATIQGQLDGFDGKELSFADQEEVERLKKQRSELQKNLDVQNEMLKLQQENSNKKAIAAVKAYAKASSEGAEETRNTWQNWAKWGVAAVGTVAAAVATGGATLAVQLASMAAAGIAGYALGNVAGEAIGSAATKNDGSYDSWYKTYTDAIETARKEEQKALEEYEKDTSNIKKLDKWQEMQQKTIDIESEMYEHINQMQSYFADAEYGQSAEMDAALDEWNTFRDKLLIDQGSQDAKSNALDRIFGENATDVVKAYRDKIKDDIENGKAVDFQEMIDIAGLEDDLDYLGITTEDVTDYFIKLGEAGAEAVEKIDFSSVISELAKVEGALESMKSVMDEFNTEGIVSASTLEGMQETFGGLGDAWKHYAKIMMSGNATMADVQAATEELAKAYLDNNSDKLTDDNKLTYIAQLEEMGVDNARELVDSYINNNFWNSTALADFKGDAEELNAIAKEYGITIEDTAKAEEILRAKEKARAKEAIRNEQILAAEKAKRQQQQQQQQAIEQLGNGLYLEQYNTIADMMNLTGAFSGYSAADVQPWLEENIEKFKYDLEYLFGDESDGMWSKLFPDTSVIPAITVSQEEVDAAEKEYQAALDGMDLEVTPEINFNKNNALEETAKVEEAFAKLGEAYEEFKEHGIVDATSLVELQGVFKNVEGFEEFTNILGDSTSTIEEVTTAIEGLANGFLNDFDYSKLFGDDGNLITSEVQRVASQLENIGVANAKTLIEQKAAAYNAIKEMYGIDLTNYESAEEAKTGYLVQSVINQMSTTGEGIVNGFADQYADDLLNFEGTWKEKVQYAKECAKKILEANKASEMSGLDAQFEEHVGNSQGEEDILRAESWYLRETARINQKYQDAYSSIENMALPEINTSDILTYYNPTDINLEKLGGNDNNDNGGDKSDNEIDWLEHYFTKIENEIKEKEADLENVLSADLGSIDEKNTIIDGIIDLYASKIPLLENAMNAYENRAIALFNSFSSDIQDKIRNGSIDIKEYDDELAEDIQNYFDYITKASDLEIEIGGIKVTIADYNKEQFDNIATAYENQIALHDSAIAEYEAKNELLESETGFASEDIYASILAENEKKLSLLEQQRKALQANLDTGDIEEGTEAWYEAVNAVDTVDAEIINLNTEIENINNSINDLHWAKFDELINRYDYIKNEAQNLIDIMSDKDMFVTPDNENGWGEEDVSWTGEGLATIGEYARQMDIAKQSADEYAKEIAYLKENKDKYNESEYLEKLNELTDAQYEQIEAYQDAKDAIVDLNKERIETIKDGIQKEIDAYEELIEKKKEELDASKEAYDFQKNVAEQSKNIADIERKLAALAYDDSASARAKKAQLEAELYEAQADLEETYYDQSISNQQDALDKELEDFQTEKEAELEKWDKYLDDVETIIQDSLGIVQSNVSIAYDALTKTANDYNIKLSDYITKPWDDAVKKVSSFSESTVKELYKIKIAWQEVADAIDDATGKQENADVSNNKPQNNADDKKPGSAPHASSGITEKDKYGVALAIWNGNYGWGNGQTRINNLTAKGFDAKEIQTIVDTIGRDRYVRTGAWKGKYHGITDLAPYHLNKFAKGSTGVGKDQWAIIDELGEELQFVPGKNGRLEYIKKGTGIVPADLTKRLIDMAMDPQDMLDRNRPSIGAPHIINNEVNIDCSVGTMVHIEHCDQNTLPDVERLVNKAFDKHMQTLNNSIRKFTR